MLKKIPILLLFAMIILSACSQKPMTTSDIKGRTSCYRATAYIKQGRLLAVAGIAQESPLECVVTYEAPAHLAGLETVFTADSAELRYRGLSYELLPSSLPQAAAAKAAVAIINQSLADGDLPLTQTAQGLVAQGESAAGEFLLAIDPETGAITKLLIPAEELEIAFANFIYLDM